MLSTDEAQALSAYCKRTNRLVVRVWQAPKNKYAMLIGASSNLSGRVKVYYKPASKSQRARWKLVG